MQEYSIYTILDPRKPGKFTYEGLDISFRYEPVYIGRGKGKCYNRKYRHLKYDINHANYKNNSIKINKIKSIQSEGFKPLFTIFITNLELNESCCLEEIIIKSIGRICENNGPLTNVSIGGESGSVGYKWSDEMREEHSMNYR